MNDYFAILKIQNGRLKHAMNEMNIRNNAELSRRSGVNECSIGKLLNFKRCPRNKKGSWRSETLKICQALAVEPDDIFPSHLQHEVLTNQIANFVEQDQLTGCASKQLGTLNEVEDKEMSQVIEDMLNTLSKREQEVLIQRFWENTTLNEIGSKYELTGNRIRCIEAKALRKLRHPARLNRLIEVCPFEPK